MELFLRDYPELWAGDPGAGPADYVRWILNVSNPFTRDEDRERPDLTRSGEKREIARGQGLGA